MEADRPTACSPLALTRATTSSRTRRRRCASPPRRGRVDRRRSRHADRGSSPRRERFASPLAALDARIDDLVCVFDDAAARRCRALAASWSAARSPWGADRLDGLRPACADTADNLVRIGGDGAVHRSGRTGELCSDRFAVRVDGFGGLREARRDDVAMDLQRLRGLVAAGGNTAHDGVRMRGDGVAR